MSSRENQSRLTVTLDGINLGVWDNKTGGDADTNDTQYQMGGMGPRVSLGGTPIVANLVVQVLQTDYILSQRKFIRSRRGKGTIDVFDQPLDDEGNPLGDPDHYNGKLKRFKTADVQSQGANAAVCELEVSVNGEIA